MHFRKKRENTVVCLKHTRISAPEVASYEGSPTTSPRQRRCWTPCGGLVPPHFCASPPLLAVSVIPPAAVGTPARAEETLYAMILRCLFASLSRVARDSSFKRFSARSPLGKRGRGGCVSGFRSSTRQAELAPEGCTIIVAAVLWQSLGSVGVGCKRFCGRRYYSRRLSGTGKAVP